MKRSGKTYIDTDEHYVLIKEIWNRLSGIQFWEIGRTSKVVCFLSFLQFSPTQVTGQRILITLGVVSYPI